MARGDSQRHHLQATKQYINKRNLQYYISLYTNGIHLDMLCKNTMDFLLLTSRKEPNKASPSLKKETTFLLDHRPNETNRSHSSISHPKYFSHKKPCTHHLLTHTVLFFLRLSTEVNEMPPKRTQAPQPAGADALEPAINALFDKYKMDNERGIDFIGKHLPSRSSSPSLFPCLAKHASALLCIV